MEYKNDYLEEGKYPDKNSDTSSTDLFVNDSGIINDNEYEVTSDKEIIIEEDSDTKKEG